MEIDLNISNNNAKTTWRTGMQPLMPEKAPVQRPHGYDVFPYHPIGGGKIHNGYPSLAKWIAGQKFVAIDGYVGVFWDDVKNCLTEELEKLNLSINWVQTNEYLKSPGAVQELVAPYLGTPGSVWGTRSKLKLSDLYNFEDASVAHTNSDITIVLGVGAALMAGDTPLIYLDLPKNELQLRMRAGVITNLGNNVPESPAEMYKRFYFVDWLLLNEHKKNILNRMTIVADGQWKDSLNWMPAADLKVALHHLATSVFRVRPWFEPGAWGGHWMRENIAGINKDEINYAWSFELIVPENGLVFESDGNLLEVSFDMLMFAERDAVLGKSAERFGDEFPIRFDFLDTIDGGNLSIQCHPSVPYIQEHFGETITQDETYYILERADGANVYLGFQEDINPGEFKKVLENSRDNGEEVEITKYVQSFKAHKHDLFLIPNGTVHSAGKGNLVLEISATPYIFTFKMYDWLRLDLNGEPRAINIDHAFNNLKFDRKGQRVVDELISKQTCIKSGSDWQIIHVPTHAEHFYDVERVEFDTKITLPTDGSCQVMMLVEGESVKVKTADGTIVDYAYAETFVVPAGASEFILTNTGASRAKVIKAFIKS